MEQINTYMHSISQILPPLSDFLKQIVTLVSGAVAPFIGWFMSHLRKRRLEKTLFELVKQHLFETLILCVLQGGRRMSYSELKTEVTDSAKNDPRRRPIDMKEDVLNNWATGSFEAALKVLMLDGIGLVKTNTKQLHYLSALGEKLISTWNTSEK